MTNEEAHLLIEDAEIKLRKFYFSPPIVGWTATIFAGASGWLALPYSWGVPLLAVAGGVGLWSVYTTEGAFSERRNLEDWRSLYLWRRVSRSQAFGSPLKGLTREVRDIIEEIYSTDAGESLLPLAQAVRIFDIYIRQQRQLNPINASLTRLYALRQPFVTKTAQLTALGETRAKSPEEHRLDDEIYWAETARSQAESSCNRLEKIVEEIHRKSQARQIQLELNDLREQLPQPVAAVESEFAPESLEEIERQIGREIETYLRLERETDEHLR